MKIWLLRPFDRVAGATALLAGVAALVMTALLAWRVGLVTDGVMDLHFSVSPGFWQLLAQGLINWISMALALLMVGRWLSSTRFRLIDLFGTQALARFPMLLGVVWLSIPAVGDQVRARTASLLEAMPTDPDQVMASTAYLFDALWLTMLSLPALVALVWMIWLMYHGYALVCNLKGQRAVFSFVGALIAAEIVSKLLIHILQLA